MKVTNIFDYNLICDLDYDEISTCIIQDVQRGNIITNVFTPNAYGIISYDKYPKVKEFCQSSKYILPDGQPLVWLSKLTKNKIRKRLTGSDFFPIIFNRVNNTNFKILFILSDNNLEKKFKKISDNSIYFIPPILNLDDKASLADVAESVSNLIIESKIDFVFLGISEPKQGYISMLITELLLKKRYNKSSIFFFLGASYEYYFNMKRRSPIIFQKMGLEWMFRLFSEPKRLLKRYTIINIKFIIKSMSWAVTKRNRI